MDKFKFTEAERDEISPFFRDNRMATMSDLLDRIETLISFRADGWVKVEDGLPEEGVPVLVFMSYGKIDVCHFRHPDLWIQSVRPEHSNGSVTQWQHISPPKTAQQ